MIKVLALLIAVLVAAPSLALAATYQYTSNTGATKTLEADNYWGALSLIPDLMPGTEIIVISATSTQSQPTTTPQVSFDLDDMSDSELRDLIADARAELESRQEEEDDNSNSQSNGNSNTGNSEDEVDDNVDPNVLRGRVDRIEEFVNNAEETVIGRGSHTSAVQYIKKAHQQVDKMREWLEEDMFDESSYDDLIGEAERYVDRALSSNSD